MSSVHTKSALVPNLCQICAKTYGNRQNIPQWSEGY